MSRFIVNCLILLLLIATVIVYVDVIAARVDTEARLFVAAGVLPLVIGSAGGLAFRGSYIVKAAFSGLVFPCAVLLLRLIDDASGPGDAEADTFLLFYAAWTTMCALLSVAFVHFLRVIVPEKHFSS